MDKRWLLFGIAILLIGLPITVWILALGAFLITVGVGFAVLGFFLSSERTPSPPSELEGRAAEQDMERKLAAPLPGNQEEPTQEQQTQTEIEKPPSRSASIGTVKEDPVARLEKMKRLMDKKLISREEYEKKKAEILSQI